MREGLLEDAIPELPVEVLGIYAVYPPGPVHPAQGAVLSSTFSLTSFAKRDRPTGRVSARHPPLRSTTSTRRLASRPSAVSFVARGARIADARCVELRRVRIQLLDQVDAGRLEARAWLSAILLSRPPWASVWPTSTTRRAGFSARKAARATAKDSHCPRQFRGPGPKAQVVERGRHPDRPGAMIGSVSEDARGRCRPPAYRLGTCGFDGVTQSATSAGHPRSARHGCRAVWPRARRLWRRPRRRCHHWRKCSGNCRYPHASPGSGPCRDCAGNRTRHRPCRRQLRSIR